QAIHQFFEQALDVVRQTPGVEAAAFSSELPLAAITENRYGIMFETYPEGTPQSESCYRYAVSPGFFETTGIRLRRGRFLSAHERADAPPVVVINESLAKRRFPDRDPIGQRVHVGDPSQPWYTIVGVVADVRQTSLDTHIEDTAYLTVDQWYFPD